MIWKSTFKKQEIILKHIDKKSNLQERISTFEYNNSIRFLGELRENSLKHTFIGKRYIALDLQNASFNNIPKNTILSRLSSNFQTFFLFFLSKLKLHTYFFFSQFI